MRLTRASHWNNSRIKTRKTDEENEFVLENPFYKIESIQLHSSRKTNEFTQLDRYESNEKRQRAKWNYWFWFVPLESFNFVPFLAGRGDSTATETPTHSRFPFPWNPPKCRKSFISFFPLFLTALICARVFQFQLFALFTYASPNRCRFSGVKTSIRSGFRF